jgi:hypothetical protein
MLVGVAKGLRCFDGAAGLELVQQDHSSMKQGGSKMRMGCASHPS